MKASLDPKSTDIKANSSSDTHFKNYFTVLGQILSQLDRKILESQITFLKALRQRQGRLFILGVGGSAANASHAVNDFRKLCGIEAYAPTDNVAELTARTNDDGWDSVFVEWLKTSHLSKQDMLFIFSVGGGDEANKVSVNLVKALQYANTLSVDILGVVGRDGGATKRLGSQVLVIPPLDSHLVTPHAEALQALVWHALVSHPELQNKPNKW